VVQGVGEGAGGGGRGGGPHRRGRPAGPERGRCFARRLADRGVRGIALRLALALRLSSLRHAALAPRPRAPGPATGCFRARMSLSRRSISASDARSSPPETDPGPAGPPARGEVTIAAPTPPAAVTAAAAAAAAAAALEEGNGWVQRLGPWL
jgi:hypothetical protein